MLIKCIETCIRQWHALTSHSIANLNQVNIVYLGFKDFFSHKTTLVGKCLQKIVQFCNVCKVSYRAAWMPGFFDPNKCTQYNWDQYFLHHLDECWIEFQSWFVWNCAVVSCVGPMLGNIRQPSVQPICSCPKHRPYF